MIKASAIRRLCADHLPMTGAEVEGSVAARFAAIAARYPCHAAIELGDDRLEYAELDRRAHVVAAAILAHRPALPEPVGLLFQDPGQFCSALLGVLRAGKFYAALDGSLPAERLAGMARHLEPGLLLCDDAQYALALLLARELAGCQVMNVDRLPADPAGAHDGPAVESGPDDIACIVYTSGSTRAPEGVMISHRALLHFVMNHTNTLGIRPGDRASQLCPFTSAACCGEIFPMLLNGGTVLPWSIRDRGSAGLPAWLRHSRITIYTSVPAVFRLLVAAIDGQQEFPDLRVIKLSGDRVLASDFDAFKRHFRRGCLFRVGLGASEALLFTQFCADHEHVSEDPVLPAGHALDDMEVFIVDEQRTRLGPGEAGEIAVRSRYLSAGYWKNPQLTRQRFAPAGDGDAARIYFTRDLGLIRRDGCLMHLGRTDFRTKIHGKWVRLDEIEEAMLQCPGIADAAVVAGEGDRGESRLTAFYVGTAAETPDPFSIRAALLRVFPPEAVPARYISIARMPLTASNKVDRGALAARAAAKTKREGADALTE